MAGSISWVPYTTDDGDTFAIRTDLSNLAATEQPIEAPAAGTLPLPTTFQIRTITYRLPNNLRSRTIPILDVEASAPEALPDTIEVTALQGEAASTIVMNKSFYRGESRAFPITQVDTGINERG